MLGLQIFFSVNFFLFPLSEFFDVAVINLSSSYDKKMNTIYEKNNNSFTS